MLVHSWAFAGDAARQAELLERGYRKVDIDSAVAHPAYRRDVSGYRGPDGITWRHRRAMPADMDRGIFRGEPREPGWIERLGGG